MRETWWVDIQPAPFTGDPIRTLSLNVETCWGSWNGARSMIPGDATWAEVVQTAQAMVDHLERLELVQLREIMVKALAEE